MSAIHLRDYQREAIEALESGWEDGQRLGVSLPTGVGKTVIMAHLAHRNIAGRVLITVHRDELVDQTVDKLRRVDSTVSVGVVKAARNQGGAAVVVASIQTIARPDRLAQLGRFGLIIVDEAHRSMSDSYQRVLTDLGSFETGGPKVAGFTATWTRSDKRGLGDFWEKIVFTRTIKWAIGEGHLVRPVGKRVVTDLDLSKVKKTAGDYSDSSLGVAMTDDSIRDAVVLSYKTHAADRQGVLFAPTVASAGYFADGLRDAGFPSEVLVGATSKQDAVQIHRRYRSGETQILATCTRLAEGWDAPWCSAAVLARPTLHSGLFIQQVGRVLRPWPGKTDAMVLDVVGTSDAHSLNAEIDLSETPEARDPEDWDVEEDLEEDLEPTEKVTARAEVVAYQEVDLFAGSDARWLTSTQGIPFVRTRDRMYFLWSSGDSWVVGRCPAYTLAGGEWLMTDSDPESMLLWVGQIAVEEDPSVSGKNASWRNRGQATVRQTEYAISLGVDVTDRMTKSQVSDAINIAIASRVLAGLAG